MSDAALSGRGAVVTGASRGIGLAIAHALAAAGARVAVLGRSSERLQHATESLGHGAFEVVCDLADDAQTTAATERITSVFAGAPDILVLNAGVFALGRVGEMSPDEFARTIAVNLLAPYRLLHAFVPAMRERGSGHVVSIGSVADRRAYPENGAYAAAKFGVRGLHEVLRSELVGTGVRASLVSPGPVDTPLWDPIDPDQRPGFTPRTQMLHPDAVAAAVRWIVTQPAEVNIDELRLTRA